MRNIHPSAGVFIQQTGSDVVVYTPFTRSSKHRANVEQMYSTYTC